MKFGAAMVLFAVILSTGALAQTEPPLPKADSIFLHGNIYTGITGSSSFHVVQRAEAMAIKGDRILAVGKNDDIAVPQSSANNRRMVTVASHGHRMQLQQVIRAYNPNSR